MIHRYFSRYISLFISFSLLIAPLPLSAMIDDVLMAISQEEVENIVRNNNVAFVYLGQDLDSITKLFSDISVLDKKKNSPLQELNNQLKNGFLAIEYNVVAEVLAYAESVIQANSTKASNSRIQKIAVKLNDLIDQIVSGEFTINPDLLAQRRLRTLVINENIDVLGKTTLRKHVHTHEGIHVGGKLKVDKNAKFKRNVTIKGLLSVVDIAIPSLTPAGVVHSTNSGTLFSSLITNADIADATISNAKLATISSADIPGDIVVRDGSGNFATNMITIDGTTTNPTDVATKAYVDAQSGASGTNLNTPNTLVQRDNTGSFAAQVVSMTDSVISSSITVTSFTPAGVVHNNASGLLSSSLIVNADVDPAAAIVDTKLATISTAGKVANSATTASSANIPNTIVLRDGSGNFSANIITADLNGNATTATTATSATNFTGSLVGDVTGTQNATVVSSVGGQTAANVAAATVLANAATSVNTPNTIVLRDGSGNFTTNEITIVGSVTNPTDAATKAYVDSTVSSGLVAHPPALVVGTSNVVLTGLQTIDGVLLVANDRVLLINQTNPVENGLWLAQVGAWTRPVDFPNGSAAGQAYVLITSGTVGAGSSYLCNTPTAVIGTDPIFFALFSLPDTTTGANVGAGTGLIFRNKTSNTLNFKTLIQSNHIVITNNANDITLATDGTNLNTINTLVARDGSGNFSAGTITASLTGAASLNVLKAGDTMTGALILPAGTAAVPSLRFTGSTNTGLSAPAANTLALSTNGAQRIGISAAGVVTVNNLSTLGVVHNSAAGLLSTSLIVNADVAAGAAIVDTKLATISTAGKVANSATTATNANTANAIVARDASGNFSAGTITASLTGAASLNVLKAGDTMTGALILPAGTAAAPSLRFTGSTNTGISAPAANTLALSTNGAQRIGISSTGAVTVNNLSTLGVVHNSAAGLLSSSLIVNADVAAGAAIVDTKLATISTAGKVANSATTATSANTANAIVTRNASGNFTTNMITIVGTTTNATDVATKAYVDAQVGVGGTNLNTPNTLVQRDGTGSFAAQIVSVVDTVISRNLILSTSPSTATAGNILKGSNRFIHDFGSANLFVGENSGNFTLTTAQTNCGFGPGTLQALTTGSGNTAIGFNALNDVTTGISNIAIGETAGVGLTTGNNNIYIGSGGPATESGTTRIGTNAFTTQCFIAGVRGATTGIANAVAVLVDSNDQFGTISSSRDVKHDIEDMGDQSAGILALRPVTFVYNGDESNTLQYGLIAEEVEELFPTIVAKDSEGKPETIKYHILPAILLNEIKKQHAIIGQQQSVIDRQNNDIEDLKITVEMMRAALGALQGQINDFNERMNIIENPA
jgi:hypothetical protein